MSRIDNWYKMDSFSDNGEVYVYGNIYGDKRFLDGVFMRTANVVKITKKKLITANMEYELGKPSCLS